ncbi:MAG: HypC/HybG/HupF family hydrogenase formation chaperone [Thermoguttaceae bacterium]|jgi:hydrogenase expression/formation protein HypC
MCLGVPGKLVEIHPPADLQLPMGKVEFGGIYKDICLAYTPEAQVGDYVLVHVGFAISRIDQTEAEEIFSYLNEIGEMEEEEVVREQSLGENSEGRMTNDKRITKHE